jgi:competence protein ComEC
VDFETIEAPSTDAARKSQASCLLRVVSRNGAALLTGDAWPTDLLRAAETHDLRADLIVLPRHGARAERMSELASELRPSLAVISSSLVRLASRRETVVAWRAAGAEVLATATCGALRAHFARHSVEAVCARDGWPWPWRRAGWPTAAAGPLGPIPGFPAGTMAASLD